MMNYKNTVQIEEVIKNVTSNNKIPKTKDILRAYNFANEKHNGTLRDSGEPYINHPLRVAYLIASLGLSPDTVIAALLHDVVEDCGVTVAELSNLFNSNVANMVNAVSKIDKHLKKCEGLSKEEIHALSDAKLQQEISNSALLIKACDRFDNLSTIEVHEKSRQLKKTQHTREILLPMLIQSEAHMLVDELENLCFKVENETDCNKITAFLDHYKEENLRSCNNTILLLENAFLHCRTSVTNPDAEFPEELVPYQRFISGFYSNQRSNISIFRQIVNESKNIKKDFDTLLSKSHMAFYDLTLVFDDVIDNAEAGLTMHDIFYKFFEDYFVNYNICVLDYTNTTRNECTYFLISDNLGNLYRLFIRTESSYMRYKLGNIIDTDKSISFVDINDIDPRDTYKPKITVFMRNGEKTHIDAGATALDFAFLIHSDLGLHFDYALINNENTPVGPHYVLNEGDEISVFTNDSIEPKIQWFRYAKTSRAVKKLVDYLT